MHLVRCSQSHINNAEIHHVNENQTITATGSLGAFRINYKYGLVESIYKNQSLARDVNDVIEGWSIINPQYVDYPDSDGINIKSYRRASVGLPSTEPLGLAMETNEWIPALFGENLTFELLGTLENNAFEISFKVYLTDGVDTYWLDHEGNWLDVVNIITIEAGYAKPLFSNTQFEETYAVSANDIPIDGNIRVTVYQPGRYLPVNFPEGNDFLFRGFKVYGKSDENLVGEFHTVQRGTDPSTNIDDVKVVYNGDNETNIYYGSLYKPDEDGLTSVWKRRNFSESKAILRINAENNLRMNSKPCKVFTGDIYGHIPYLSKINIDGITGDFMVLSYNYDTYMNTISLKIKQIHSLELNDVIYEKTLDYGETVKPTIR